MSYLELKDELFIKTNVAEETATGLYCVGYNDFNYVKPIYTSYSRPFKTLHFIISGSGTYHVNGKEYHLHKGQMFFTPSNIPIGYYPDEKDPWKYVWYTFSDESLAKYMSFLGLSLDTPCKSMSNPDEIIALLYSAFSRPDEKYNPVFNFLSVFMQIMSLEANVLSSDIDAKNMYVQRIKKCIEDNYTSQDFTVDTICNILHLSHSYICRIFQSCEGTTIINYIKSMRMKKATDLLVSTDISVSKIACMVGYRDPLHFMKEFKKIYGTTAARYRS